MATSKVTTKDYIVYRLNSKGYWFGKMKNIDSPAIREALRNGCLPENNTWDCDEQKLLNRLKRKGV